MNILIACDSFKDGLNALEVCESIKKGLQSATPSVSATVFPLADGGEGTFDALQYHLGLEKRAVIVSDPLFRKTTAFYGVNTEPAFRGVAFIEMAQAAGLQLLKNEERNPLKTTTFGVGEMILDAVKNGATQLVLAIGGSATNDAGIGMAAALGYEFFDEKGEKLLPIGENLEKIKTIDNQNVTIDFSDIKCEVICDVKNPLFGSEGAAYVYARQKGADDAMIERLDLGLKNFAKVVAQKQSENDKNIEKNLANTEGAGAAGGLGFGAQVFLNATLRRGIDLILDLTNFDNLLKNKDLVITGEGRLDSQTAQGKLITGIVERAQKAHVPVVALCGALEASANDIKKLGLLAAFPIGQKPTTLAEALQTTGQNLEKTAFNVARIFSHFVR